MNKPVSKNEHTNQPAHYQRVVFSLKLECLSNTHIGDGSFNQYEKDQRTCSTDSELKSAAGMAENKTAYAACSSKGNEQMYIPGSTLKNMLRRASANIQAKPEIIEKLFGSEEIKAGDQKQGGLARISDALIITKSPIGNQQPHWSSTRGTGIYARNSIDADTLTAEELFYQEFYPKGTVFAFTVTLVRPTSDATISCKQALENWQGELDTQEQIGANQSKSWGQVKCTVDNNQVTTLAAAQAFFNDECHTIELKTESFETLPKVNKLEGNTFIPLEFETKQPVLIADPSKVRAKSVEKHNKQDQDLDAITYHDGENYIITTTAFWGAFKALAKRIAKSTDLEQALDIFGNQTQRALQVKPWIAYKSSEEEALIELHQQTFIAIDNLTQGAKKGALIEVKAIPPKSKLKDGGVYLNTQFEKLEERNKTLLSLTLAELIENGLWLGGKKAAGYGLVHLTDTSKKALERLIDFDSLIYLTESKGVESFDQHNDIERGVNNLQLEKNELLNPYALISVKHLWNESNTSTIAEAIKGGANHSEFKANRLTGKLRVKLTTKSPVFIGNKHESKKDGSTEITQYTHAGRAAIPASSIRGMVQNISRILSHSRFKNINQNSQKKYREIGQKIEGSTLSLDPYGEKLSSKATPNELIFGVIPSDNVNNKTRDFISIASRVRFTDTLPKNDKFTQMEDFILPEQSSPKNNPEHIHKTDQGKSVRFPIRIKTISSTTYKTKQSNKKRKSKISPIKPDQVGFFDVYFYNLSAREFELLSLSMFPELPLNVRKTQANEKQQCFYHKIGLAKNRQLGNIVLEPDELYLKSFGENKLQKQTYKSKRLLSYLQNIISNDPSYIDGSTHEVLKKLGSPIDSEYSAFVNYAVPEKMANARFYKGDIFSEKKVARRNNSKTLSLNDYPKFTKSSI